MEDALLNESALHELLTALRSPLSATTSASRSTTIETTTQERETACVVCRLTTRSVIRWLRAFLDEYVNDPAIRETIRRAEGFCESHTRMLAACGDSLAVAILYGDLARLTVERWEKSAVGGGSGRRSGLMDRLRGGKSQSERTRCPACVAHIEAQNRFVQALAAGMESEVSKEEIWQAVDANAGICVPHIQQLMGEASPAMAKRLRDRETQRLTALQAELAEIVRKNDYRFRGESWGAEKDAWRRALDKLRR